ncbi:Esa1p-associated factor [Tulasnella sp. 424]|nr:Esa1p-associated factor [Tulasnella sp. 424]KAG8967572.1 Esa1p-associated factor [Tulasnella sp. 425]
MATTYAVNERMLCYHGPLVYEAKVLKAAHWDETTTKTGTIGEHYFVHYKGWKQTWDEWVPASRLLKFNDTNLALQKSLMAQFRPAAKEKESSTSMHKHSASTSSNIASSSKDGASQRRKDGGVSGLGGSTSSRKRGRDEMMDSDAANAKMKKPEMKLEVPDVLKVVLVDDWEAVTKNNQLVPLPRSPTVEEILTEFKEHCASSDKKLPYVLHLFSSLSLPETRIMRISSLHVTISIRLLLYFERSLGNNLLYRFERGQYADARRRYITGQHVVIGEEKTMGEVYGAEHLLRMLVNLPSMIAQTSLDPESVAILREYIVELMNFMVANKTRFFLQEYENAPSHYVTFMRS